ncbi:hypothetical protein Pla52o_47000 [Novipirellula galeiformis]|uniref:Uncharacterized protein n=1 Tax=Novipirellula galeiformis TaxID=2528004 RepID=A0A5C6C7W6_9BACT|nr:hypothetical protein Pla52o_47000 [Novipirellula galeiformis]
MLQYRDFSLQTVERAAVLDFGCRDTDYRDTDCRDSATAQCNLFS